MNKGERKEHIKCERTKQKTKDKKKRNVEREKEVIFKRKGRKVMEGKNETWEKSYRNEPEEKCTFKNENKCRRKKQTNEEIKITVQSSVMLHRIETQVLIYSYTPHITEFRNIHRHGNFNSHKKRIGLHKGTTLLPSSPLYEAIQYLTVPIAWMVHNSIVVAEILLSCSRYSRNTNTALSNRPLLLYH
jgi:hypothetical protein